jgi:hypothetical protein
MTSARKLIAVSVASLAALGAAGPAHAASGTDLTSIQLIGGTLDFGTGFSASNFPATSLNGMPQTVTTAVGNWSVNDARGTLLGWNVKVQASQFTDDGGTPADATDDKTLPAASLSLTAPTASAGAGQSSLLAPVVQPVSLPIDGGAAVPVAIAALTKGAGLWNFAQGANHLSVVIPPTAQAGTFSSTITTTLSSGIL